MEFIKKNIKTIGICNAIAIGLVIILKLFIFKDLSTISKIDSSFCIVAMIFGIFYALNGYKKDSAKYYKLFMIMYYISSLLSLATPIALMINNEEIGFIDILFVTVWNIVIVYCVTILTIGKDLEKDNSANLCYVLLVANIIKLLAGIVSNEAIQRIAAHLSNLLLACIVFTFVFAKYIEKSSRGAK